MYLCKAKILGWRNCLHGVCHHLFMPTVHLLPSCLCCERSSVPTAFVLPVENSFNISGIFVGGRLNKTPPNLTFRKKDKGGINFTSTVTNTHLYLETVKAICSEYKIHNADISLRYDATADDLIDVIEGSRIYMPCIYVVNKIDQITLEELEILDKLPHYCPIR
jgi:ribosome-interacting GTPase 1